MHSGVVSIEFDIISISFEINIADDDSTYHGKKTIAIIPFNCGPQDASHSANSGTRESRLAQLRTVPAFRRLIPGANSHPVIRELSGALAQRFDCLPFTCNLVQRVCPARSFWVASIAIEFPQAIAITVNLNCSTIRGSVDNPSLN